MRSGVFKGRRGKHLPRAPFSGTPLASIVKKQLIICPILAGSLHFGVCVTRQSHQGLRQQQQINFTERTVLTRFITRVNIVCEILRWLFLKLRQIIYFQKSGFRH